VSSECAVADYQLRRRRRSRVAEFIFTTDPVVRGVGAASHHRAPLQRQRRGVGAAAVAGGRDGGAAAAGDWHATPDVPPPGIEDDVTKQVPRMVLARMATGE
jgi:hypothetical protein